MCGIAGWINLKENLTGYKETIEKMTLTLGKRGPDATGYYTTKNVLLGHRRLVVVDPEGGAQPMTRDIEGSTYTLVYNGELYNTEELRAELKSKGHSFNSYSDTEVLLVSYIEWGESCVDYLNGIYAFGVWDDKKNRLFLARDPLGVKPLFYTQKGSSFIFASEIKTLLAHPQVEPLIDENGLCEIFGLGPARSLGSGVFKDIYEVCPGNFMIYDKDGLRSKEYWKLKCAPHTEDLDTTVEHTRSLVVDAIERQLVSDVPVCTFLSGGLDSSAISAVAANYFKKQNRGILNTFSIDYKDNELYFKSNDFEPNSDRVYAERMSQFIASNHQNIIINTDELAYALVDAVRANDLPGYADIDSSLYLFCKEVRKQSTVALSGECADEIFGGYPWYTRDEDFYSTTFPWSKSLDLRKDILSPELSHLPIEDYVASKYEESIKAVPFLDDDSKEDRRMRELFYLNMKWFMLTLLNRKDRMSMSNSLEVRVPYADYRIVEYSFNIPRSIKLYNGREKGLLRMVLKGILPDDIVERKKSPYPKTHHPLYTKIVKDWANNIINDSTSPILQLIDKNKLNDIINSDGSYHVRPWYGQLLRGPQQIAYFIQINEWMKEYKVKLV
ncbi:asparagine synthetase [glutamine-hydrolyzing] 3 [Oxobacter pfennigii]|uniref:asparagine synthase (glutamine-hydrolyzing) n=1 Tax=Oxobacter pfennigii TaxID=36849 RepID=A0A0P8Y7Z6_9CLOT|nr:asparagine synthase (glutamine-hydrolyzing) [Oxobacter pfennigii]KPU42731.1 asparagine synthetase [glutamine-hydrolyzing] 3 [Oxobacter pfennigii]